MTTHYSIQTANNFSGLDSFNITAPFDGSTIASSDVANEAAVESALTVAFQLYQDKSTWLSKTKRIEILQKTASLMEADIEHLAIEAAREGGKPYLDSKVEVIRAIDSIRTCADVLRNNAGKEIPMGVNPASEKHLAITTHEPIGVVVAVSAFNHPLNLIAHQVGPAIAAGCPVIVKPAADTPLSCFRLLEYLYQAGLEKQWCQSMLITNRDLATKLVTDSRVSFFSFIGSAKVGWMLNSKLAPGTRSALEHGGVAPVIIEPDADLDSTIPAVAKGGFYHAGQVCVSVQRIYCHESIIKTVTTQLKNIAENLIVGDPTDKATEVGPLIRTQEVERTHSWVKEAINEGATLITGGQKKENNCYSPTILLNPSAKSKVSCMEVFAPVICLYSYTNIDSAIASANSLPFSFQASVFSKNIDTIMKAYKQLNASAVMANDHTAFRVDWMPFAGLKQSGLGTGGIPHTFHDMQVEKMLVIKSNELS
ncbi:MAG: aldehyde dehydrogenase family protein [Gammaproteobacteria bacterium]|nr:aldehyde dehydrogenase family protein [Gammaproteobacteria bacterium]